MAYLSIDYKILQSSIDNLDVPIERVVRHNLAQALPGGLYPRLTFSLPDAVPIDDQGVKTFTAKFVFMPSEQWESIKGTLELIKSQLPDEYRHYIADIIHDVEES